MITHTRSQGLDLGSWSGSGWSCHPILKLLQASLPKVVWRLLDPYPWILVHTPVQWIYQLAGTVVRLSCHPNSNDSNLLAPWCFKLCERREEEVSYTIIFFFVRYVAIAKPKSAPPAAATDDNKSNELSRAHMELHCRCCRFRSVREFNFQFPFQFQLVNFCTFMHVPCACAMQKPLPFMHGINVKRGSTTQCCPCCVLNLPHRMFHFRWFCDVNWQSRIDTSHVCWKFPGV